MTTRGLEENEREFQGWIIETAQRFGWRVWHVPTPMRPVGGGKFVPDPRGAGLPDLILFHSDPPRLIFAEVKVNEPLSDVQREFLRFARAVAAVTVEGALRAVVETYADAASWSGDEYQGPTEVGSDPASLARRALERARRTIGVYVWRPAVRELIEETLRGKVLSA